MRTRACIFDMDGVLIDSGSHHRAAWAALLVELGATPARPDYWRLTIGRPAEEAVPLLLGHPVPDDEARRFAYRKRELYLDLARRGAPAVPGVGAFVEDLVRRGVPRGVGTSATGRDVERILRALGLRHHFEIVVSVEDVAWGKPDPEVYTLAAARMRVPPESCLVFEDSLVGIEAARRAGMRAVGVATAHDEGELRRAGAERVVADFEGLTWTSLTAE
ncbi:MAG TPA: HAD family phosphatase [Candidatus Binatia bacterium]|nr:HAD family phosphatase [Candidatus Binatia bacterium]